MIHLVEGQWIEQLFAGRRIDLHRWNHWLVQLVILPVAIRPIRQNFLVRRLASFGFTFRLLADWLLLPIRLTIRLAVRLAGWLAGVNRELFV